MSIKHSFWVGLHLINSSKWTKKVKLDYSRHRLPWSMWLQSCASVAKQWSVILTKQLGKNAPFAFALALLSQELRQSRILNRTKKFFVNLNESDFNKYNRQNWMKMHIQTVLFINLKSLRFAWISSINYNNKRPFHYSFLLLLFYFCINFRCLFTFNFLCSISSIFFGWLGSKWGHFIRIIIET